MEDITFYKAQCGQNIHKECMEEWKKSHPRFTRCPMCRHIWKTRSGDSIEVEEDLYPDAVQIYIDWLYSGQIRITTEKEDADKDEDEDGNEDEDEDEDEDCYVNILRAWKVSSILEDDEFRYALIAKYFSMVEDDDSRRFWAISIAYAFEEENIDSMREFIIDVFRTYTSDDWEPDWTDSFPAKFLSGLVATLMKSEKNRETHKELLSRHTENRFVFKDDDFLNEDEGVPISNEE